MPDLLHQILIEAPREAVLRALTTQEGLQSWWTAAVVARPQVGHINIFGFEEGEVEFHFRVDELGEQGGRWTCVAAPKVPEEWVGTVIHFTIESAEEGVALRFGHLGWRRTDGAMTRCNAVWGELMHRLRDFAEGRSRGPYFADKPSDTAIFSGAYPIGNTDMSNLPVKHLGPAIGYYTRVLGFTLVSKTEKSAALRRGQAQIGLAENGQDPEQASCYFAVSDIEALHRELEGAGIEPSAIRVDEHEGKQYRVCFAREPYGVCFCFGKQI